MAKRKEIIHVHYVHHFHYNYAITPVAIPGNSGTSIMVAPPPIGIMVAQPFQVTTPQPGQSDPNIMVAPGFYTTSPAPDDNDDDDSAGEDENR